MRLTDWRIPARLHLLSALLLLILVIGLGWSQWRLMRATQAATAAQQRTASLAQVADDARAAQVAFKTQIQEWKNLLLRGGQAGALDKYREAFKTQGDKVQRHLDDMRAHSQALGLPDGDVQQAQAALQQLTATYLKAASAYDPQAPDTSAHRVDASVKGQDRAPTQAIDAIVQRVLQTLSADSQQAQAQLAQQVQQGGWWSMGWLALSLGVGVALTRAVVRSITQPLRDAVAWSQEVAQGRLKRHRINPSRDELGDLLSSLQTMVDNLGQVVGTVRSSADAVAMAAEDIEVSNGNLSQRTENQASTLQQSAATIEHLSDDVQRSAQHAQEAEGLARSAADQARQGGGAVQEVVATMQEIQHSSAKIADIISVIDGIAFQTNILALNAAVEAARAGEQGRGFAVVAGEVRSLAQRSAGAAREIKDLILASQSCVTRGGTLVHGAGDTIVQAVQAVEQVRAAIESISASASQQARGIAEVNGAIGQFDGSMQQTAAQVEEAAAAAMSLRQQSQSLKQAVAFFQT